VFITVKAHVIPTMAPAIGASLKGSAAVIGAMNGIPWWYFEDRHLESVDPGGIIARSIPYEQVVGAVVYPAASLAAPGVVRHEDGDRISLGEPDGSKSERVHGIARMLAAAGFKAPVQTRLRNEIWLKLLGNATLNPLSAITHATMGQIFATDDRRGLVRSLMEEVAAVASARGTANLVGLADVFLQSVQTALEPEAKSSMCRDVERGRPLEVEAINGAVVRYGEEAGVPTPRNRTILDALLPLHRAALVTRSS